ncbi:unnamed protein product [Boreogadus saida]
MRRSQRRRLLPLKPRRLLSRSLPPPSRRLPQRKPRKTSVKKITTPKKSKKPAVAKKAVAKKSPKKVVAKKVVAKKSPQEGTQARRKEIPGKSDQEEGGGQAEEAKFRCRQEGSLVVISRKSVPDQSAFISRMLACMANNGPNFNTANEISIGIHSSERAATMQTNVQRVKIHNFQDRPQVNITHDSLYKEVFFTPDNEVAVINVNDVELSLYLIEIPVP